MQLLVSSNSCFNSHLCASCGKAKSLADGSSAARRPRAPRCLCFTSSSRTGPAQPGSVGAPSSQRARAHRASGGHRGAVGRVSASANGFDPQEMLRDFDRGTDAQRRARVGDPGPGPEDRGSARSDLRAWAYNGRVPGPTLRRARGRAAADPLHERLHPPAHDALPRHPPGRSDGVPGIGPGNIHPGESTVYEFDATPFGLHLYHCHSTPLAEHIAKGLYGAFIIDPKDGRARRPTSSSWS